MKTVLILTNSINGLYSFRRELIERLKSGSYNVIISSPQDTKSSYFEQIECQLIDTFINRRGINPIADFRLLFNYFSIIRKIKPDVVLTYTIKPNIYGGMVCRLLRIPYITNITGLGTAVENGGLLQRLTVFLYRIALKKVQCVFFQNEENLDFMRSRSITRDNYRLIPGSGVNLEYFQLIEYPDDDEVHFLFISRIMKEKGIDQYLEAAEYIKNKYNTCFHVCGFCGEDYQEKLGEMQSKGIIIYHGVLDDVREILKITHCTIHPTYYPEGMSNVLLESAACGRPIITTDRSGCREIVDDGVNGYIVKQKESSDLIEKIEQFMALDFEEKRKMGLAGRKKVEKGFDRQLVVDAYIEEIEKVI